MILDPFMGSGTTAMVAKELGRFYLGCELHEDYGKLIEQRLGLYYSLAQGGTADTDDSD